MIIRQKIEREILQESGRRLGAILQRLTEAVKPGISTGFLDELATQLITEAGGDAVFKGYKAYGSRGVYPGSMCVSLNDEIVHGIPRADRIIREGDIVSLDIGMRYPKKTGLVTDMATTVLVGNVPENIRKLLEATEESLYEGIKHAKAGNHIGDIGHAIERRLTKDGLGVIRELVGHGVGNKLHEDPYVPNFGNPGEGEKLVEGMVLALEPMATLGSPKIFLDKDGWTYKTKDGSLAAHFEHTIVIKKNGAEILTKG